MRFEVGGAHLQWSAHDDQEVGQWEVCQVLEEVTWKFLPEEHDVRLDHALTGGTLRDRPAHHIWLMRHGDETENYYWEYELFSKIWMYEWKIVLNPNPCDYISTDQHLFTVTGHLNKIINKIFKFMTSFPFGDCALCSLWLKSTWWTIF